VCVCLLLQDLICRFTNKIQLSIIALQLGPLGQATTTLNVSPRLSTKNSALNSPRMASHSRQQRSGRNSSVRHAQCMCVRRLALNVSCELTRMRCDEQGEERMLSGLPCGQ
jgi:hypothetical protein